MADETYESIEDLADLSPEEVAALLNAGKLDGIFGASGERHHSHSLRRPVQGRGARAQSSLREAQRRQVLDLLAEDDDS